MSNRKAGVCGVAAVVVAFSGACSDMQPTEPRADEAQAVELFRGDRAASEGLATLDAEFERIAREVAGFGGMFRGEDGSLNVYMVPSARAVAAPAASAALSASLAPLGVNLAAEPVNVLEGEYDFLELSDLRRRVSTLFSISGVVAADADEARNRVWVGVEHAAAAADVERALLQLAVPRGAVLIEEVEPIRPMQSLQSRVRPVAGGLQLVWPDLAGSHFLCTLGFNVQAPQRPHVQGFVTNSHCTAHRGTMNATSYWQHTAPQFGGVDSYVGAEAHDIPFFTGGPCPAGRVCRWSDAAGVQYTDGVEQAFGQIYRTTGIGSLTIDAATPRFEIVAERPFPMAGDLMNKVGRTTGWTQGTVSQTCVDTNVSATNITMLCQDWVLANVGGGDSGSPVFERIGASNDVRLTGILWGGGVGVFVFSAMENVRFENEGAVPWITFPGQTAP